MSDITLTAQKAKPATSTAKPFIVRIEKQDEIINTDTREQAGGKVRVVRSQPALAILQGRSMSEISIPLGDDRGFYPAGDYILSAGSFTTNRWGNLDFNNWSVELIPLSDIKAYL